VSGAWETKQLADVAELQGRIGWKGLTAKEYTPEGPYFLSVHSLNYGDFVDFRDAFHISQERYDESPEIMLKRDDVLICKDGAGIGKVGIVGEMPGPSTINSSLLLIRAKPNILPKYLYLILQSPYFQEIVQSRLEGATTPHLYQRDIATFPIRLPPLEEQRRIVAVLDEAFAAIATATANAEKNLGNARELFTSLVEDIFESEGNWALVEISKFAIVYDGPHATPKTVDEGPIFLGISALEDGEIKLGKTRHVTPADFVTWTKRVKPRQDDVVFSYETRLGQAAIIPQGIECCLGRRMGLLRVRDGAEVDPSFLLRSYLSPSFQRFLQKNTVEGATVDRFSIKDFPSFSMRIPPLKTQREVVRACQQAKLESDRLVSLALEKLARLANLRQSLLHRAFSGQLTEREPLAA
jgi:type I restriction enzyme S subunit